MTDQPPVAFVTGGSRGVGRAVVEALAAAGYVVAFSYRRDYEAAEELTRSVAAQGGQARGFPADFTTEGAGRAVVEAVTREIAPPLVLVCNAGVASTGRSVLDTGEDEFRRLFQVHVLAAVESIRAALPAMREARRGCIVLVSSTYASIRSAQTAPYAAAKSALEALAEVLAREERDYGVRVNIVAPDLVATDMGDRLVRAGGRQLSAAELDASFPFGRVCRPVDVANVVAFLTSESASYVTGHRLVVDGGGDLPSFHG